MRAFKSFCRPIAALLFCCGLSAALAQTPAPSPKPTRPAPTITRLEARAIMDGAIAYAAENKLLMGVVVLDVNGDPVASERMDGAGKQNIIAAQGKAFAASIYGQTTEELGALYKTRPDRYFALMSLYPGKFYLVGGGEPLIVDGAIVGAVGVAGLPEGVDEKAGRAGIAAWMKYRESMKK